MIPFQTTKKEIEKLDVIIEKFKQYDFDETFIADVKHIALNDQGVFDLANLWFEEVNENEKEAIFRDICYCLNDYGK